MERTHGTAGPSCREKIDADTDARSADAKIDASMRPLFAILLPFALAACAATGTGGPVLPGLVNAPPPPIAAEDSLPLGVVWSWQSTQMSDGALVVPDGRERYTLLFQPGGTVRVRADCNSGSGSYVRSGNTLAMGPVALTRMACPADSRDAEFLRGLSAVSGHLIRGNDLVLTLKADSGSMRFVSRP